jgi:hypothetical protein
MPKGAQPGHKESIEEREKISQDLRGKHHFRSPNGVNKKKLARMGKPTYMSPSLPSINTLGTPTTITRKKPRGVSRSKGR